MTTYPTNIFPEVGIVYIIYSLCFKHDMACKSVALGIIKNQSYQPFYTNLFSSLKLERTQYLDAKSQNSKQLKFQAVSLTYRENGPKDSSEDILDCILKHSSKNEFIPSPIFLPSKEG